MFFGIKILAISLAVMKPNMFGGAQACYVPWRIILTVVVDVMAMGSGLCFIYPVSQIPFVRQTIGCIKVRVKWLVDHLVSTYQTSVEGHQRITRTKIVRYCLTPVSADEAMIGGAVNNLTVIERDFHQRITPNVARFVE